MLRNDHQAVPRYVWTNEKMVTRSEVESAGINGRPDKVLNRFYMYLDEEDKSLAVDIERDGFWEAWVTAWVLNNIPAGSNCVDVGANQGYYSLLLSSMDCKVLAIEPIGKYVDFINASAVKNGYDHLDVVQTLAGDRTGTEMFYEIDGMTGSSSVYTNEHAKFIIKNNEFVPITTLDTLLVGSKVDFVKIDVEGAEARVWAGMRNVRLNNQDLITLMEFTPANRNEALAQELTANWDTRYINYDGKEIPVESAEWLNVQPDFVMLVIRSKV